MTVPSETAWVWTDDATAISRMRIKEEEVTSEESEEKLAGATSKRKASGVKPAKRELRAPEQPPRGRELRSTHSTSKAQARDQEQGLGTQKPIEVKLVKRADVDRKRQQKERQELGSRKPKEEPKNKRTG